MTDFNLSTPDSVGLIPNAKLLQQKVTHTGNGKTYTVIGFAWLGASDEWGYVHIADMLDPYIVRPLSHLIGTRSNGEHRYAEHEALRKFL